MFRSRRSADDFNAEIEAHLQLEIDRLKAQGLSAAEARSQARRAFGNVTSAEERFYDSAGWQGGRLLAQNIRFGLRMLARNPGSSALAIFTLALGIGANTAIFSLLNAVLLRHLPVREPNQLVLFGKGEWNGSFSDFPNRSWQLFSYDGFHQFQRKNQVFTDVAAIDSILFTTHGRVGSAAGMEKVAAELVSGSYFHTLGVNAFLGRTLTGSDDVTRGGHPLAVASYSWWRRRLAADPSAIGSVVTIGETPYRIIGVAQPGFSGIMIGQSPDLWIPLAMQKQISPGWNGLDNKLFQSLYVIARRKPGVSLEQAAANVNVLFKQILQGYAGPQPSPRQLADIGHATIELTAAATGLSNGLRFRYSSPLEILMAVVAVVLLIACANVANLLLARATARRREIAIRMSIGAGRARLIQQLLVESGILGLAGALLGVLFAWIGSRSLLAMVSTGPEPLPVRVAPDAEVLAFALAAAILTVILSGTVPAFGATRLELAPSLKEGRGIAGGFMNNRLARCLIVGQVALSLALLAGAGLFLRSLVNLMNVNPGFDSGHVVMAGVDAVAAGYHDDPRAADMMLRLEDRVSAVPGIQGASFALMVFNQGEWTDPIIVPGRTAGAHDPEIHHDIVGRRYFDVLRMPVILGRTLSERDTAAAPKVAVINETMAQVYFPGGSPVGRTFSIGHGLSWKDIEIVGVVRDAKYDRLQERPKPAAFYPHAQHGGILYTFIARYSGPSAPVPEIKRAVADIDPNLPIDHFRPLAQLVGDSVQHQRLVAQLSTLFGFLAALLACVGIYGVMSYGIARRTNEFGVRMALGARKRDVLGMVLREALSLVLTGVAIGIALALAASRLVASLLFGLQPYDPVVLAAAALVMVAVALLAGWLPARRATRIDPIAALRYE